MAEHDAGGGGNDPFGLFQPMEAEREFSPKITAIVRRGLDEGHPPGQIRAMCLGLLDFFESATEEYERERLIANCRRMVDRAIADWEAERGGSDADPTG